MKNLMSSPKKIIALAVSCLLIVGIVIFATIKVNAGLAVNKTIGMDKATAVALSDAGISENEAVNLFSHYDTENRVSVYEVNFSFDSFEYEYRINAADGAILDASKEKIEAQVDIENQSPAPETPKTPAASNQTTETTDENIASAPTSKYIGVDKAKSLALSNANLSASDATFTKAKLEHDDGLAVYEIEFHTSTTEYEFEINASTGAIRDYSSEGFDDDDWNDHWDDDHEHDDYDDEHDDHEYDD